MHRQQNDNLFLSILNRIRHGNLNNPDLRLPDLSEPLNVIESLTLNAVRKNQISGENAQFRAIVSGKFQERDYPTASVLELKVGARIMLLNNKRTPEGQFEYVNGDIGIISAIKTATVCVTLDNGRRCEIQPYQWTAYEYELETDKISGKEVIRQKEVGNFVQLPMKLAYAITIHKSQGLSLERVHIRLGNGCFAHGQLYTALSRCRSLRNLRIDRPLYVEDVVLDAEIVNFYKSLEAPAVAPPQEVTMNIPKEHETAVMAFLEQLRRGEKATFPPAPAPDFPPTTEKPSFRHSDCEIPQGVPATEPIPAAAFPEGERIRRHTDIDKLLKVYRNQTGSEKADCDVKERNGHGFNKVDAPVLTPIAEFFLEKKFIRKSDLREVSFRIAKYHRQWNDETLL